MKKEKEKKNRKKDKENGSGSGEAGNHDNFDAPEAVVGFGRRPDVVPSRSNISGAITHAFRIQFLLTREMIT